MTPMAGVPLCDYDYRQPLSVVGLVRYLEMRGGGRYLADWRSPTAPATQRFFTYPSRLLLRRARGWPCFLAPLDRLAPIGRAFLPTERGRRLLRHITICTQKLESRAHLAAHHHPQEDQPGQQQAASKGLRKGVGWPCFFAHDQ